MDGNIPLIQHHLNVKVTGIKELVLVFVVTGLVVQGWKMDG